MKLLRESHCGDIFFARRWTFVAGIAFVQYSCRNVKKHPHRNSLKKPVRYPFLHSLQLNRLYCNAATRHSHSFDVLSVRRMCFLLLLCSYHLSPVVSKDGLMKLFYHSIWRLLGNFYLKYKRASWGEKKNKEQIKTTVCALLVLDSLRFLHHNDNMVTISRHWQPEPDNAATVHTWESSTNQSTSKMHERFNWRKSRRAPLLSWITPWKQPVTCSIHFLGNSCTTGIFAQQELQMDLLIIQIVKVTTMFSVLATKKLITDRQPGDHF